MKVRAKKASARIGAAVMAAASATLAFPALAFASEEGESSGISAILPEMDEFIPMIIGFVVIAVVLYKFGWPMFEGMLEKRENTIKEALEKSEAAQAEAERTLEEYKRQLDDAKTQASQIIADAKTAGEAMRADLAAKAQAESEQMIEKARVAIEAEKKSAIAELQGSVADISVDVASRLVGSDLSDDEHRKIIEHYVSEAGSFNG